MPNVVLQYDVSRKPVRKNWPVRFVGYLPSSWSNPSRISIFVENRRLVFTLLDGFVNIICALLMDEFLSERMKVLKMMIQAPRIVKGFCLSFVLSRGCFLPG